MLQAPFYASWRFTYIVNGDAGKDGGYLDY